MVVDVISDAEKIFDDPTQPNDIVYIQFECTQFEHSVHSSRGGTSKRPSTSADQKKRTIRKMHILNFRYGDL
jgi:hypothetical protein